MLSRNPLVHYVFAKMELAEERGLGLKSMKARASELGLPLPQYKWQEPYLKLTLFRSAGAAERALPSRVLRALSKGERVGWQWLSKRQTSTSGEFSRELGLPYRTAMHHLERFQKLGLLEKSGSGRATVYRVRR